ncbi:histidine kinase N-terminal domain-containing protein [uncultured Megasphaera sp.]|uniref:histidine kinase N-terminal domain-containing protein n=1 Tax=uncultured Megasphaera sp. TaxID=165188 RepID=UPI0025FFA30D|nr:histidine kinase N-terminal domain-containing protein [uncultured Megasphaera sp.]
MAALAPICRTASTLSPVQIHILQNSEELLQFASDLSHRELFVYVPGRREGTLVLAAHRTPLLQKGRQSELSDPGTIFSHYEEPLNYQVFQDGRAMHGEKEIEYGRTAPIMAYPFVDNGGRTIAVIAFVGVVEESRELLTETAFLSLQVPMDFHSMYRPLSIQDGVVLVNCNGIVIYADDMADSILHMCGQHGLITGTNIYNTRLDVTGGKQVLAEANGLADDITVGDAVVSRRVIPILQRGKVRRVISILTERTELHRKEAELMVKTSVIKEIHHRVKNNLQTIASLLRMQMRRTTSEEAQDVLKESLNRILSIALVHETLSYDDDENINLSDVAQKLLGLLAHSLVSKECRVETKFSGDKLLLPSDVVTSLALILNELITNAIIHGFEGRAEGRIFIDIRREDTVCVITVCDDGIGMSQVPKDADRKRLGMAIVRTLIEKDLHGTIAFSEAVPWGTAVTIRFPLSKRGE